MPADHGSRCTKNERLFPPGPHLPQHNPEQLMQGGQSTTRTFGVQSQQLPTESQVFEDEVRPATERTDQAAEEMPERHDHGKNFSGKDRIKLCGKSLISQVHDLLARHTYPACTFLPSRQSNESEPANCPSFPTPGKETIFSSLSGRFTIPGNNSQPKTRSGS